MTLLHSPVARAKRDLWLRLRHYHFDALVPSHLVDQVTSMFGGHDASTRAFAAKVARKAGWTRGFALRAVDEYRKFVYLGCISDEAVTPPRVIDRVWHEHLLFSRAYREFCRDVLHRDFDHHPELVPVDVQTDVFQAQYEATLERYEAEFHLAPPADIWGTPKFGTRKAQRAQPWSDEARTAATADDLPLYLLFDGSGGGGESHGSMTEFGGGGGFSGGGGGFSWGDGDSDASSGSDGAGDGADCGDGGSGCSSSCGGGGE